MKLYTSRAWLYKRFIEERKSVAEMAKEANVSQMTIRRSLEAMDIKR